MVVPFHLAMKFVANADSFGMVPIPTGAVCFAKEGKLFCLRGYREMLRLHGNFRTQGQ
jgi:hypothetical protein